MKTELRNAVERRLQEIEQLVARGDIRVALVGYEDAAQLAAQAEWPEKELEIRYNQGALYQQTVTNGKNTGNLDKAIACYQQALDLALSLNEQNSAGIVMLSLGFACANAGYEEEAIEYFQPAVEIALEGADFETAYGALTTLGVLLSNHERPAKAIPYYRRALELAQRQPDEKEAVADTQANLGVACEKTGQLEEALAAYEAYRKILFEVGDVKLKMAERMAKDVRNKLREKGR